MKFRIAASISAAAVAALSIGLTVVPAAAAKAPRSAAVSSIHRLGRVSAAASPSVSFRVRGVAPVSRSQPVPLRAPRPAAAASK